MADAVRSLWIGRRLSTMERLSIASFIHHGHPFHLYTYDEVEGTPDGTVILDANRILPASRIFQYKEHQTYAGFSNFFRYRALLDQGGWWVDADMVCVAPLDFASEYVFSSEGINGHQVVNVGALKVPAQSAVMQYAWDACEQMDPAELKWSQCGPTLMRKAVEACALEAHVAAPEVFCPIHFSQWGTMLDASAEHRFGESTRAVHLWNELWRREGRDKDAEFAPDCLYETLKRRYL
jgi:mannosyltransferase OCH1-like enzyme